MCWNWWAFSEESARAHENDSPTLKDNAIVERMRPFWGFNRWKFEGFFGDFEDYKFDKREVMEK